MSFFAGYVIGYVIGSVITAAVALGFVALAMRSGDNQQGGRP